MSFARHGSERPCPPSGFDMKAPALTGQFTAYHMRISDTYQRIRPYQSDTLVIRSYLVIPTRNIVLNRLNPDRGAISA
jgi:hypothetical protein